MKPEEYVAHDAMGLAELVAKREVSAAELAEAAIDVIERHNATLNAVVTPLYEMGREAAANPHPGPFSGVPFLLKDLIASMKGARQTSGARYFDNYIADADSELVTRFKNAGLNILGKTNTPEFGINVSTEPAFLGAARNPWNSNHSTGGSSGGAAAAVAAGYVPAAHASDGGGSIRIPSSACGTFGLKPSRARVPAGPFYVESWHGFATEGVLSRTVRDSAALLDAIAGPEVGDYYAAPPAAGPFLAEVGRDPGRLRIAVSTKAPEGVVVDPECIKAAHDAAKLCESLGHTVDEADLPYDREQFRRAFGLMVAGNTAADLREIALAFGREPVQGDFEENTYRFAGLAEDIKVVDYLLALRWLQRLSRDMGRFFETWDVLITPTLGQPPHEIGYLDPKAAPFHEHQQRVFSFIPFTPIFNVTGQPAMSVPLHWTPSGLPVGVQFATKFGDDALLFRLAAQLEQAKPWAGRRPPIFG